MDAFTLLSDLDHRIQRQGLNMAAVCREAGISHSLVSRWKAKLYEPRLSSLARLEDAFNALVDRQAVRDLLDNAAENGDDFDLTDLL